MCTRSRRLAAILTLCALIFGLLVETGRTISLLLVALGILAFRWQRDDNRKLRELRGYPEDYPLLGELDIAGTLLVMTGIGLFCTNGDFPKLIDVLFSSGIIN